VLINHYKKPEAHRRFSIMDKFQEIKAYIIDWIKNVSVLRPELGGHAICPFASKAKYKIIQCKSKDIEIFDGYDVVIYVIEDHFSLEEVQQWVEYHNKRSEIWSFFEDCASYDTFIQEIKTNNGKYNLIIGQPIEKLRKFREKLAKTSYYTYWKEEYLQEILQEDYNLIQTRDSNPVKSSDLVNQEKINESTNAQRD